MADSHTIKLSNATSYCLTFCSLIQRLVSWLPHCICHRMASALEQWPLGKPSGTVRKPAIRARMVALKPNRSCALLLLQLTFRVTAVSYMPGLPNRSSPQTCVRDTRRAQVISHSLSSVSVQPWYSTLNQSVSRPLREPLHHPLQEILSSRTSTRRHRSAIIRYSREDGELRIQVFTQ